MILSLFPRLTLPSGNVYIGDILHARIRKVTVTTGIIDTVAGGGAGGADYNGPATSAKIAGPSGIAIDSSGRRINTLLLLLPSLAIILRCL